MSGSESTDSSVIIDGETSEENLLKIIEHLQDAKIKNFIERLTISSSLGDHQKVVLDSISSLPALKYVSIERRVLTSSLATAYASSLPWEGLFGLKLLDHPKLGPRGTRTFAEHLSKCESLQDLRWTSCGMGLFGAEALSGVIPATLCHLNLSNNKIDKDALWHLVGKFQEMSHLKSLDLSKNPIGTEGCHEVAKHLPNSLTVLTLKECKIEEHGLAVLATKLPSLSVKELHLDDNSLSDTEAIRIGGVLSQIKSLEILDLSGNKIGDQGCVALVEGLVANEDNGVDGSLLRELVLNRNMIGDVGAGAFVEHVEKIKHLRVLSLDGNDKISEGRLRIISLLLERRARSSQSMGRSNMQKSTSRSDPTESQDTEKVVIDWEILAQGRKLLTAALNGETSKPVNLPQEFLVFLSQNWSLKVDRPSLYPSYEAKGSKVMLITMIRLSRSKATLKQLRDTFLDDLFEFQHESLLPLLAISKHDPHYGIVYNRSDCLCLRVVLENPTLRKTFTWKNRVSIALRIAQAIEYLHTKDDNRAKSFHGDVSSSNIYVSRDFEKSYLLGAGLSRVVATDQDRFESNGDVAFGTRSYRCPRYERGSVPYSEASDIFSFGILLAELLSGKMQRSMNVDGACYDVYYDVVLTKRPMVMEAVPDASITLATLLDRLIRTCLSHDVKARPSSSALVTMIGSVMDKL